MCCGLLYLNFYGCLVLGICKLDMVKLIKFVLGFELWLVVFLLWILLLEFVVVFGKGEIVVGWLWVFIFIKILMFLWWYLYWCDCGFGKKWFVCYFFIIVVLFL